MAQHHHFKDTRFWVVYGKFAIATAVISCAALAWAYAMSKLIEWGYGEFGFAITLFLFLWGLAYHIYKLELECEENRKRSKKAWAELEERRKAYDAKA